MATLYLVSTPIGNLQDLSARAAGVLASVQRILAEDTRRTRVLAERVGARAPLVSLHAHNEAERVRTVIGWLDNGEDVALVSDAGTPLVSDPGARLVRAVAAAGHQVVPVPGPSAVLAALVASGIPAPTFTFLGFPARKGPERRRTLERAADSPDTVVLFEAANRLVRLLSDLAEACGPGREVAVARELTKLHEEIWRGTLSEAVTYYREHPARGEVTLVVAPAPNEPGDSGVREEDARRLARELLAAGRRSSSVAREVARRLAIPRNRAYRIVLDLEER